MKKGLLYLLLLFFIVHCSTAEVREEKKQPSAEKEGTAAEEKSPKKDEGIIHETKLKLVNTIIQENFPREFDFDRLDVYLFGFGAEFYNLRISENPDFGDDDFFTSEYVNCDVQLIPFLADRININQMSIEKPRINIIRNAAGDLSLIDLLTSVEKNKALVDWMEIARMNFSDGELCLIDKTWKNGPALLTIDKVDVDLRDFSLDRLCSIKMTGRMPGSENKNLRVEGLIGPMKNNLNINQIPIDATVSISNTSIDPLKVYVPPGLPFYPVSGFTSLNLNLKGVSADELTMVGDINLKELVIANNFDNVSSKSGEMDIKFNDKTKYKPAPGVFIFDSTEILYDGHKYYVNGLMRGVNDRAGWDVVITTENLEFDKLRRIYPPFDGIIPLTAEYTGDMDMEVIVQGDLENSTGSVKFGIDDVRVQFFDMILKNKTVPAFVEMRGDKNIKGIINIDGNFFFRELEVLRVDVINSIIENLFNKLVKFSSFVKYGKKIKETVQQFINYLQEDEKMIFTNIVGGFDFSSFALDVKKINLPYVEMVGLGGSDIILKGNIPLDPEGVDFKVKIFLPEKISSEFVKSAEPLKILLNSEGSLLLPIVVTGSFEELDITLDVAYIKAILKQRGLF